MFPGDLVRALPRCAVAHAPERAHARALPHLLLCSLPTRTTQIRGMDAGHAAHAHAFPHDAGAAAVVGHKHGSWGGHVLPGALFLVLGMWWLLASAASYHQRRRLPFRPQPWYPFAPAAATPYKRLVMLEPLLLTALPLFGCFVELYFHPGDLWYRAAVTPDGARFVDDNLNNWQHAAMYSAFAFSGACALALAQPLARVVGFLTLAQAFAVELLLFWFHLRMQTGLVAEVHVCLCLAVAGCVVAVLAEAALCDTGAVAPSLARAFFTLLQGTWFCQAAHILYGEQASLPASMRGLTRFDAHQVPSRGLRTTWPTR